MHEIPGHHISQQFDLELESVRTRLLAMGGLVEQQIADAVSALTNGNEALAREVIARDHQVNAMEVALDEECERILAIRQPAASDLRLIFAVIKTITDLERMGDQAERVAGVALRLAVESSPREQSRAIRHLGELVQGMFRNALDAFARMDVEQALAIAARDGRVDDEYEGFMRQLITFMMEDPRNIHGSIEMMWAARALERIGDHTKNICEYLIFMVKGKDVRHIDLQEMAREIEDD